MAFASKRAGVLLFRAAASRTATDSTAGKCKYANRSVVCFATAVHAATAYTNAATTAHAADDAAAVIATTSKSTACAA